jgi:hypothetical protein
VLCSLQRQGLVKTIKSFIVQAPTINVIKLVFFLIDRGEGGTFVSGRFFQANLIFVIKAMNINPPLYRVRSRKVLHFDRLHPPSQLLAGKNLTRVKRSSLLCAAVSDE